MFCRAGATSLCSTESRDADKCDNSDGKGRCELFAPEGFVDHWAFEAEANPDHQTPECPASMVTGKPDRIEV